MELIDEIVVSLPKKDQREKMFAVVNEFKKSLTEATDWYSAGKMISQYKKFHCILFLVQKVY